MRWLFVVSVEEQDQEQEQELGFTTTLRDHTTSASGKQLDLLEFGKAGRQRDA
jgi:hypothetical protein